MEFDHLVIAAEELAAGVRWVETVLGVNLQPGGRHEMFGTHNALLSLGPSAYLEVISVDPGAPIPDRPRWYGLDHFSGPPRLTHWVLRTDDINKSLASMHPGVGMPVAVTRANFRWQMAVPQSGLLPYDDMHPAVISWDGPHPAAHLPDAGIRLQTLHISHPKAEQWGKALSLNDSNINFENQNKDLTAYLTTPSGPMKLSSNCQES